MQMTQSRKCIPPCSSRVGERSLPAGKHPFSPLRGYEHSPREQNFVSFESLYQSHRNNVYKICLRMLKDPVQAEDLAQESFVQAFCKIHTFRGEAALSTWLYRLTTNVVLASFRQNRSKVISLDEIAMDVQLTKPNRPDVQSCRIVNRIDLKGAV